jgi:hypothetical protein
MNLSLRVAAHEVTGAEAVIPRWRGGVLLLAYAAFVTATLTV